MSTNLTSLFSKGIDRFFGWKYDQYDSKIGQIFHEGTMDTRVLDRQSFRGYGLPAERKPGGLIEQGSVAQSYGKRYIAVGYALGDSLPYEDREDDQYGFLSRLIPATGGAMANSFRLLEELMALKFVTTYGFASGTSVPTMADGLSLFNTAHPVSLGSTATYANRPSTDVPLSLTSYQDARVALMGQYAGNGLNIISNMPRVLVVSLKNELMARHILSPGLQPFTADNTKNLVAGEGCEPVVWPYLTTNSSKAWFVVGKTHHLNFLRRQNVRSKVSEEDTNLSYCVTMYCRFVVGADDARGTYGSYGSAV